MKRPQKERLLKIREYADKCEDPEKRPSLLVVTDGARIDPRDGFAGWDLAAPIELDPPTRKEVAEAYLIATRGLSRDDKERSAEFEELGREYDLSVFNVVAVSDFVRAVPDQISRWVPGDWLSLGTDGFGRSDTRAALRRFFEIDHAHLVVGVLAQLALRGEVKSEVVADAVRRYDIDPDLPDPWSLAVS